MDGEQPRPARDSLQPATKKRWIATLSLGTLLWLAAVALAHILPQVIFDLRLQGWPYGVVGLLQAILAPVAIALALSPARARLQDLGLTTHRWQRDALIGAGLAVGYALLQFLVIIPHTGGADRSDVAMNAAQIGDSLSGVAGFLVLAWTGSFSEELFFRGLVVTSLLRVLGGTRSALASIVVITSLSFAFAHGYQGWTGVVDTGLYGGLTLTLLCLWRRCLTACIVAHAVWNTLATLGIYFWY
jgi:hypothetical protein